MTNKAFIAGVGMIPFAKPGANAPYPGMAAQATRLALADAGVAYDLVQQAYVGYVYGDSTAGQKALYGVGMTGIPIVNVNNNCSTGSTALFLARQAVESGAVDCVLALGFEQMNPGAIGYVFTGRPSPFEVFDREAAALVGMPELPLALRYFGGAGQSRYYADDGNRYACAEYGQTIGSERDGDSVYVSWVCAVPSGARAQNQSRRPEGLRLFFAFC